MKHRVHIKCLCGHDKYRLFYDLFEKNGRFRDRKLIKCNHCGLIRIDPSPLSRDSDAYELYDDPNYYTDSVQDVDFWLNMADELMVLCKKR